MKARPIAVLLLVALALLAPGALAADGPLAISVEVPVKNRQICSADTMVAGSEWDERVRVTVRNTGEVPVTNLLVAIGVPLGMPVSVPPQPLPGVTADGETVRASVDVLGPGESTNLTFGVRPPASVGTGRQRRSR